MERGRRLRYLLDTHALIWIAREEKERFSGRVISLLQANPASVYVSAVSAWEMATKSRIGKLPGMQLFLEQFEPRIQFAGFSTLGISIRHSLLAGQLEGPHKDPFDRFLAAQALLEKLTLLSNDRELDLFGVERLW